jgi:hypothetical protein
VAFEVMYQGTLESPCVVPVQSLHYSFALSIVIFNFCFLIINKFKLHFFYFFQMTSGECKIKYFIGSDCLQSFSGADKVACQFSDVTIFFACVRYGRKEDTRQFDWLFFFSFLFSWPTSAPCSGLRMINFRWFVISDTQKR